MNTLAIQIVNVVTAAALGAGVGQRPGVAEFEREGVRVRASVSSSRYVYTITNVDARPIVGFEVGRHNTYNEHVPTGWEGQVSPTQWRAWAASPEHAVHPLGIAYFDVRVSSQGAVLGAGKARVILEDGKSIEFPGIWESQREPRRTWFLVPGAVAAIMLLHTSLLARRAQSGAGTPQTTEGSCRAESDR